MTARTITCFKAYDLRGRLGDELDEDVAWRVGRAFAARPGARRVVVGRDGRDSSPALAAALMRGLVEGGVEVLDLGVAGTEEMYFATDHLGADGGIEVTGIAHGRAASAGVWSVCRGRRRRMRWTMTARARAAKPMVIDSGWR